ncbi:MAG: TonB-dependent receptor [Hyphomonas sp. BRH_c22]|uniref:TonB-dependent receptor domain-containing protein n=1 Tax=Hyphomonas sp. BRH_c22 TaxID=1629710 RepID=UPI0005F216A1|nr:TonB-dependent receptor [Hyphomonas sp. BRH_c22]KJS39852.1 MAG: TonB-dependent receptor [Hyphomonas sp. BRH_c22]
MHITSVKYKWLLSTAVMLALSPIAGAQEATPPADTPEDSRTLQTVVVRGQFIPEPQRETSQVATFLSSEDLARQGDSNAALALTRLSGLSIVSGRFAFVRGLGDRYSSALLNGSPLPSPEPLRRTVPLDLFPSSVLAGAAVQKTYSANYPGEFGGGVIDLETLRQPSENFLTVKGGISANTETTGSDGLYVNGGDLDWSGYDDGLRDIPGPLAAVLASGERLSDQTPEQIETIGESLVNSPLSVIQQGELGPDPSGSIEGGLILDKGQYDIGLIGVVGFDSGWTTRDAIRQSVEAGVLGSDQNQFSTTYDATLNALGSGSIGWGDNEIQATLFYVHTTSKQAEITTGTDFNAPGATGEIFDESSGWFERELAFFQLRGEHGIGDLDLNWRGAYAVSTRDAPYDRSLRRSPDADGVPLYSTANNYNIVFSDLEDTIASFGADATYTVDIGNARELVMSGGFDVASTDRDYNYLSLRFVGGNALPADAQAARPDYLFSPDNIDPARFILQEVVTPNDSYSGALDVNAFYVQTELDILDYVRGTVGFRYEDAEQTVETFDRFGNPGAGDVNLSNDYVLPALTLTWNFADDLQLRAGYSQTIARPQFRELALSSFVDPETDRTYRGNSGLVDSELKNYDARLEYYLGRNQFVTLGGFYKDIKNPIEEVQYSTASFVFETTFINSPKAELYGAELEYRTNFAMPISNPWMDDREWLFSANYTYTASEVQAQDDDLVFDPISRSLRNASLFGLDGSDLQGTPENILNAQFGWQSDVEQMTLLVGWVDERILQRGFGVGAAALPDVIEDPGIQLDLVYNRDFTIAGREMSLGLKGRNLLGEKHIEYQTSESDVGRTEYNTYERGTTISASLSTTF